MSTNFEGLLSYEDQVGLMLLRLEVEELYILANKVKPENHIKFIAVVKQYIDKNLGHQYGWRIVIASDYSSIKKELIK